MTVHLMKRKRGLRRYEVFLTRHGDANLRTWRFWRRSAALRVARDLARSYGDTVQRDW